MFNVGSIVELESQRMQVLDPVTKAPLPAYIELASARHPKRRKIEMQRSRDMRSRFLKTGKLQLTDPADDKEHELDLIVDCTLSWEGVCDNNVPIPCTPMAVRKLYESADWLRAQVVEFMNDSANFLQSTGGD